MYMKGFLRSLAVHAFVIWLVAQNLGGITYRNDFGILILGATALTIANSFLKPIINIFLLPLNLMTLGLFRWVANVATLYISTLLVSGFSVVAFTYQGLTTNWFIIPSIHFPLFGAFIIVAFFISLVASFIFWLIH